MRTASKEYEARATKVRDRLEAPVCVRTSPQDTQELQGISLEAPRANVRASDMAGQQNLRAFHHPETQYPYLMSNSHCSLLTTRNAAIAVRKPTIVTMSQPTKRSLALRMRPRRDLCRRRRYMRIESLMASCNQSTEEKDEYQTRMPFARTTPSLSRSASPVVRGASYAEIGRWERKMEGRSRVPYRCWVGDVDTEWTLPGRRRTGSAGRP
jgi:hypothetical protein